MGNSAPETECGCDWNKSIVDVNFLVTLLIC